MSDRKPTPDFVEDRTMHREETLFIVYLALGRAGITGQLATDAVTQMLNSGILFRERLPDNHISPT